MYSPPDRDFHDEDVADIPWAFIDVPRGRRYSAETRRKAHVDELFFTHEAKLLTIVDVSHIIDTASYRWKAHRHDFSTNAAVSDADVWSRLLERKIGLHRLADATPEWAEEPAETGHGLREDPADAFEIDSEPTIRVSVLLKKGAALAAIIFIASLLYWLWTGTVIINPFLAILLIIGLPFVYLMGTYVEKGDKA